MSPPASPNRLSADRIALGALGLLLVVLLVAGFDASLAGSHGGGRTLLPGEATPIAQAESLVHDGDLRYERLDFDRHFLTRPTAPPDLSLATGSAGRVITFDHPVAHGLWLAPFLAWRPAGHVAAHALLLVLAAGFAAWRLRRVDAPPALVFAGLLVVLFATAAFAHVFLATPGAWAFAAALAAAALLVEDRHREGDARDRRPFVAGALVSLAVVVDPLHLVLVVVGLLVLGGVSDSLSRRVPFLVGVLGGLAVQALAFFWVGGGLGIVGTERFRFRQSTGFPLVDFPAAEWADRLRLLQAIHFEGAPRLSWGFDAALWGWDLVDLFLGRHLSLLFYFPGVLAILLAGAFFGAKRSRLGVRAWLVGFGLWLLGVLVFHPFDLADGPTVANARFLPLAAFSLLALGPLASRDRARSPRTRHFLAVGLVGEIVFLGALGLSGLWGWLLPGADRPLGEPPSPIREHLPWETTQKTLPGPTPIEHGALRVRPLDASIEESPGEALVFDGDGVEGDRPARFWISSLEPLDEILLEFGEDAPSVLEVADATLVDRLLLADGGIAFRVEPELVRRHVLWWSPRRQSVYRLGFHFPDGSDARLRFRVVGERFPEEEAP